jgi:hypothetical protein
MNHDVLQVNLLSGVLLIFLVVAMLAGIGMHQYFLTFVQTINLIENDIRRQGTG